MALAGMDAYSTTSFTHGDITHDVFVRGSGPAVIVMAEMPGITPKVLDFADRVVELGCTVYLPFLFGEPGKAPGVAYTIRSIVPACVSKEFRAFATGVTAPIQDWLRALCREAHAACGGPGVGAIGMCFTGGFALGMMVEPSMVAPVLSQPSLPIGPTKRQKASIHLAPDDVEAVKQRADEDDVCVLGMRFSGDSLVPDERFATLRRELGDRFIGVEIDSSPGNPHGIRRLAHSVVTEDCVPEDPDHPTAAALEQVLDFFRQRLDVG